MVRDRTYPIKRHPKFQAYKDEVVQLLITDSDESQSQPNLVLALCVIITYICIIDYILM